MIHNHCHAECEHKHVKYCPHCKVAYCEDCGKEWGSSQYTYYQPYYGTWSVPCSGTGGTGSTVTTNAYCQNLNDLTGSVIKCNHKEK